MMFNLDLLPLSEIKIQKAFEATPPKESKLNKVREFLKANSVLDEPIVITPDKTLLDGYTRYLVAKEANLLFVPVQVVENDCTFEYIDGYIVKSNGKINRKKLYRFINRKHLPIKKGDMVIVKSTGFNGKKVFLRLIAEKIIVSNQYEYHKPVIGVLPESEVPYEK